MRKNEKIRTSPLRSDHSLSLCPNCGGQGNEKSRSLHRDDNGSTALHPHLQKVLRASSQSESQGLHLPLREARPLDSDQPHQQRPQGRPPGMHDPLVQTWFANRSRQGQHPDRNHHDVLGAPHDSVGEKIFGFRGERFPRERAGAGSSAPPECNSLVMGGTRQPKLRDVLPLSQDVTSSSASPLLSQHALSLLNGLPASASDPLLEDPSTFPLHQKNGGIMNRPALYGLENATPEVRDNMMKADRFLTDRAMYDRDLRPRTANGCTATRVPRSEERRVGKERRSRWSPYH